ncbi:hypothetical protein SAMN05444355_1043 [Flavobacterium frigoris]|uniref:Uncharacterized protein n=1 Tax=Flavobacterium frigoris TaxID=229204 RepID=A0A1H9IGG7_FLAFI|nr:hypothetical protein [Flavobacterium frigoris]SEQ73669.1 hypothetical protein SAMN05444355_1043 [Flavobacterium frigoris]
MKKPTNKLPHFELSGSSYFRVIHQFLDFTLLASQHLNKNFGFSRFMAYVESLKLFLLARRKIVSIFLFLAILFIATSSYAVSSLAVFIITSFTFSWTLFLSSSKK